jgi:hypothetical protein
MTPSDATLRERPVRVQLLQVPGCPLALRVRAMLCECLRESRAPTQIEELEGPYPSPTVLVDGVDVVTGAAGPTGEVCCRLDLPTRTQIRNALRRNHDDTRHHHSPRSS